MKETLSLSLGQKNMAVINDSDVPLVQSEGWKG